VVRPEDGAARCDIVEGAAGVGAGDVGEVAWGVAELAVGHDQMASGRPWTALMTSAGPSEMYQVRYIVLMEKPWRHARGRLRGRRGRNHFPRRDDDAAPLGWGRQWELGAEGKNDNEQSQAGQFFNASTWRKIKRDSSLPSE